jgi:hypothetical protein
MFSLISKLDSERVISQHSPTTENTDILLNTGHGPGFQLTTLDNHSLTLK